MYSSFYVQEFVCGGSKIPQVTLDLWWHLKTPETSFESCCRQVGEGYGARPYRTATVLQPLTLVVLCVLFLQMPRLLLKRIKTHSCVCRAKIEATSVCPPVTEGVEPLVN